MHDLIKIVLCAIFLYWATVLMIKSTYEWEIRVITLQRVISFCLYLAIGAILVN